MITLSSIKVAEIKFISIYVLKITEHSVTIFKIEEVAKFSFQTTDQDEMLLEVDTQLKNVAQLSEN